MPTTISDAERTAILDAEIQRFARQGYRVTTRTAFTAQLVKPKHFSAGLAIVGLLFLVIGLLVYLLAYAAEKDMSVYLAVDEAGKLSRASSEPLWYPAETRRAAAKPQPRNIVVCPDCGTRNDATFESCAACHVSLPVYS